MFFLAAMAVRESHSCAIENGTDSFFYSFGPLVLSISKKKAAPMYILSSWLTSLFCHILRSIQVIFVERRDLPLFTSPHSSRFVMLNTNSWVIEESFFNIRLISASRIGLCRIMQLLSSQVVFIYMQNKTKQKKQVVCFVLFCFPQILRFEMKKLPVAVLTGSISFIPFLSSVLCLHFYNLANILAPNPWSRAG